MNYKAMAEAIREQRKQLERNIASAWKVRKMDADWHWPSTNGLMSQMVDATQAQRSPLHVLLIIRGLRYDDMTVSLIPKKGYYVQFVLFVTASSAKGWAALDLVCLGHDLSGRQVVGFIHEIRQEGGMCRLIGYCPADRWFQAVRPISRHDKLVWVPNPSENAQA